MPKIRANDQVNSNTGRLGQSKTSRTGIESFGVHISTDERK